MRYAIIESGKVTNIVLADAPLDGNWVPAEGASIGDLYADGVFTAPPPDLEALARNARSQRNRLLSASDWTQVSDAQVDRAAWATYRQALRDIPDQAGFPTEIVWPSEPV